MSDLKAKAERLSGYRQLKDSLQGLPDPSAASAEDIGYQRGYKAALAMVDETMRHICAKTDEALVELLASGIAPERIARFRQHGTGHTGLSVDEDPVWWSRVEHEGYTIHVRFEWEDGKQPTPPRAE